MLRKYWCLIVVLVFCFITGNVVIAQNNKTIKWVVEKNSTLNVDGKSNINSFSCKIIEYASIDTILLSGNPAKPVKLSGGLQMDIMRFDCGSSLITKDLRKTLKATEYPRLIIRFLSLRCMPVLQGKNELIKGWVEVELAGISKRFEICYSFSKADVSIIQLNGGRSFCFSDFNLTPPRKLGGLIKIKDDFSVSFQLMLRPV